MFPLLLLLHPSTAPAPVQRLQYHLVNRSSVDIGTGMAPLVLKMSAYVTITFTDSAAGRIADVAIDSSAFDGGVMSGAMPSQLLDDPRGVVLHAFFVNGSTRFATLSAPNMQAMQLIPLVRLIIAGTRSADAGDSWVDSTTADTATRATSVARMITSWTVRRGLGTAQFTGAITGSMSLGMAATNLELQTTGDGRATARNGQYPTIATARTAGHGKMVVAGNVVAVSVQTEATATLFWPPSLLASLAQIP